MKTQIAYNYFIKIKGILFFTVIVKNIENIFLIYCTELDLYNKESIQWQFTVG
jgi:hypothetical protein